MYNNTHLKSRETVPLNAKWPKNLIAGPWPWRHLWGWIRSAEKGMLSTRGSAALLLTHHISQIQALTQDKDDFCSLAESGKLSKTWTHIYENLSKIFCDCAQCLNPPLQTIIVITQGNPGLPWVFFHVESTIDYSVGFSLIVLGFKIRGIPWVTLSNHMWSFQ